eukprot:6455044-Amphidinium_carterae.2
MDELRTLKERAVSALPTDTYDSCSNFVPQCMLAEVQATFRSRGNSRALLWIDRHASEWQRQVLSYSEVWALACRAAKTICCASSQSAGRVGFAIRDGIKMATIELAILLAGKSIVPLDPLDPVARVALVMEAAEVTLTVVSSGDVLAHIESAATLKPALSAHRVVLFETLEECTDSRSAEAVQEVANYLCSGDISGSSISHVFFTSGSTGRPKGCI